MPREAILMHGTAEALEKMNATMGAQMRPLAEKLDAFAADGSKVLDREEILALRRDMATMKNAFANVRENGIEVNGGHIEVDKSLLAGMEKILEDASRRIDNAKATSVIRTRDAFLREVGESLSLDAALGGKPLPGSGGTHPIAVELAMLKNEFVKTLHQFATGKAPMDQFDTAIDKCIAKFNRPTIANLENILANLGVDPAVAKGLAKTVDGLHVIKAQFKEMMESTDRLLNDDAEFGIATEDVRRIMLGEKGLSNVVGAKALGFKPGDVDPAAEESNIVSSKTLGKGAAGKTYLLTTKNGGELVFKPELDGRIGMDNLLLGQGGAYTAKQKTANLNLATQDTAKAFGCEDVVVKYSVGSHDGQFGVFMEKAKGISGDKFAKRKTAEGDGVPPAEMHKIADPAERTKIKGDIARQLNKLMWLDLITGQGDRHRGNYFVHVDPDTHEATVKGIDNDASFTATRTGLVKFALDKGKTALFKEKLESVCRELHGRGWKTEHNNRVMQDPAIVRDGDTMTIDLAKAKSPEVGMALIHTLGLQSTALPEEIDRDFFDHLMEMDGDPAKKKAYLDSIAPRISPEALRATAARLDEAIAHAKKLAMQGKVYGKEQWRNEANLKAMTGFKASVTITKTDGGKLKVDNTVECVLDYNERRCPSYFKREYLQNMFNPPA